MGYLDDDKVMDLMRARQATGLQSPLLASNQPIPGSTPMQPFEQMPSPMDRAGQDDGPSEQVPQMGPQRGPASMPPRAPKPIAGDEGSDESSSDESPLDQYRTSQGDLDSANRTKMLEHGIGSIGEMLANRKSAGHYFLGANPQHIDVKGFTNQLAANADQKLAQKKDMLKQAMDKPAQDMQMQATDPTSNVSKMVQGATKAMLVKAGMPTDGIDQASAAQINASLSPEMKQAISQDNAMKHLLATIEQNKTKNAFMERTADRGDARLGMAGEKLDLSKGNQQMAAGKQYSHEMGDSENQLLAANKATSILDKISSKDLQSTPQLRSDLAAALSSMMAGGKPATVYGMSHQDFDSLYGRAQKNYQFLTGDTGDSMTDAQLTQLKKDVHALQGEYQQQRKIRYDSMKQSIPENVRPSLDKRYETFTDGAAPSSKMAPDDIEALNYVKQNPGDQHNAAILMKLKKKYPGQVQ
jgi:hypothetical protein